MVYSDAGRMVYMQCEICVNNMKRRRYARVENKVRGLQMPSVFVVPQNTKSQTTQAGNILIMIS
jgi:hypothetical protein